MGEWGKCIRLKWPNDLYAVVGDADGEGAMKKIGGILVNTSFRAGKVEMVVGEWLGPCCLRMVGCTDELTLFRFG